MNLSIEKEISKLNQIRFKNYEEYDFGNILHTLFLTLQHEMPKSDFLHITFRMLRNVLVDNVGLDLRGKGYILFVFSNCYKNRQDYKLWFNKVVNICRNRIVVFPQKNKLCIPRISMIYQYFIWKRQCMNNGYTKKISKLIASGMCSAAAEFLNISQKIDWEKIRLVTVLCDLHGTDCFLVQSANHKGIDTATLQHGMFSEGADFAESRSQIFLGYGKHSYECYVKSRPIYSKKFIEVGMPQLIDVELPNSMEIRHNKAIGVIFSGGISKGDDKKLLNIAILFAEKMGFSIHVKLHPDYETSDYDNINWDIVEEIHSNDIDIFEFSRSVLFSVVGGSTVFIEYLLHLIPVFYYEGNYNPYSAIEWCKFNNEDNLEHLYNQYINNPILIEQMMKDSRKYFSEYIDVKGKYSDFFEKYDRT